METSPSNPLDVRTAEKEVELVYLLEQQKVFGQIKDKPEVLLGILVVDIFEGN